MTVSAQTPYTAHTGNAVATVFAYSFKLLAAADLLVTIDGVTSPISYTVAGVGDETGSITFTTAPADGTAVVLRRSITLARAADYQTSGDFLAPTVNSDFDRLWMAMQGIAVDRDRSLRVPFPETLNELPEAADRVDKLLSFDADGQPALVAPSTGTATALALDLASSAGPTKGAGMVAFDPEVGYTAGVGYALRQHVFAALFVEAGDTDFGQALNRAVQFAVTEHGGGVVDCPAGGALSIVTTVLVPSGVVISLNGCRITGGGIGFADPMFESAYVDAGVVTTNVGTAAETHPTLGGGVVGQGATIEDAGTVFNLFNFLDNCIVEGIQFNDCTKPVYAERCFYLTCRRLFSRGTASASAEPAFHFDSYNNVITLDSIYVVGRTLAFKFEGGTYGLQITNVSAEGCTTGLQFRDTVNALTIGGACYFETVTTALDFGGASPSFVGVDIGGCWFNLCTTALTGTAMQGTWRRSNRFNTGANAVTLSDATNFMQVELGYIEASGNGTPAITSNFTLGTKCSVEGLFGIYDAGTGSPTAKTNQVSGLLPLNYTGDAGTPGNNVVAFCTHAKTAGTTFDIVIDTKIAYGVHSTLAAYNVTLVDNVGSYNVFGRIVGANLIEEDATAKTVTLSNSGGFVRLTATSFSHPGSTYTATGVVRHL